ncbi:MAG TPA: hypothetical protein EYN07_03910 [Flavobacteriaceae bacterium]|jgi:hypothetical protein|nr:hypothetical protein [Flavobacteriaceae bacterium]MAM27919.1 hypothetical protein [Flavobacteriaceae bacterium]MAY53451.1 hypothetical protein [Flavobacteriaceae bacterium]HBR54207.1 hypothetical protein [Flavobacteriaceae bacterium]HIB49025.1 hypothetical protein [Flavobacteriaceae bacterium]|tara:strand:+ start:1929 stop:2276 length:348 start_codon:yes stop_codon:yes gene_type:complete
MGSEVIILPLIFGVIFGIFYLYISARNKERLALIDKGAHASIFYGKDRKVTPIWKVIVINLALLLMGIGAGTLLSEIIVQAGMEESVARPGTIFLMAGVGLFLGFVLTKKLNKDS